MVEFLAEDKEKMNIEGQLHIGIEKLNKCEIEEASKKARMLLSHILKVDKEYLVIHSQEELSKKQINKFQKQIHLLSKNVPIQYITGKQEFMKLDFLVNKHVLIPRQDTECLVEKAIEVAKEFHKLKILDLCTGSGAIAISLATYLEHSEILATDISKKALKVAKKNSIINKVEKNVSLMRSNLFNEIRKKEFDMIVSNPPYIKTQITHTLEKQVKKEPILALDGGRDGLRFYKRIIENAYQYLKNNGYLILEIGYDQKKEVMDFIQYTDQYSIPECIRDLDKNDRVIICKKKG